MSSNSAPLASTRVSCGLFRFRVDLRNCKACSCWNPWDGAELGLAEVGGFGGDVPNDMPFVDTHAVGGVGGGLGIGIGIGVGDVGGDG